MIKRLVCLLSAVMVVASSAFAWDAYSFTGVYDAPSIPNLALSSSLSSASSDLIDLTTFTGWASSGTALIAAEGYYSLPGDNNSGVSPAQITGTLGHWDTNYYYEFSGTTSFKTSIFTPHDLFIPYLDSALTSFKYTFSEPYPESVSLDGLIHPVIHVQKPSADYIYATGVDVRINNNQRFYFSASNNSVSISDIFTDYAGIQSIEIFPRFENNYTYEMNKEDVSYLFAIYLYSPGDSLKLGVLSDNSALNGEIDEAQGNMNDLDSVESEWTGSMTSNFDALDLGNFSFPSGLVSGFALITGIFQDLWNSMGEYKILFVFPLTLGVVLLLIGRISKFDGQDSSRGQSLTGRSSGALPPHRKSKRG